MSQETNNLVLTTKEACQYLRISRPTFMKFIHLGLIRAVKVGTGWKILQSELDRFFEEGNPRS
jgi:excisionase family DNA binding protein